MPYSMKISDAVKTFKRRYSSAMKDRYDIDEVWAQGACLILRATLEAVKKADPRAVFYLYDTKDQLITRSKNRRELRLEAEEISKGELVVVNSTRTAGLWKIRFDLYREDRDFRLVIGPSDNLREVLIPVLDLASELQVIFTGRE